MAITPLPSAPQITDDTATFNTKAFAWVDAIDTFTSEANSTATQVNTDASTATTQAGIAATKASEAATSATLAEDWATKNDAYVSGTDNSSKSWAIGGTGDGVPSGGSAKDWATKTTGTVDGSEYSAKKYSQDASTSADAAAASAVEAAGLVQNYQGALASDPSLNKDGGALAAGDWYVNTSTGLIRAYDGSQWVTSVNVTAGVSGFSAGTTGLTPNTNTQGDVVLGGTLGVANGGTGATSLTGVLIGDGTNSISGVTTGVEGQILQLSGSPPVPAWLDLPITGTSEKTWTPFISSGTYTVPDGVTSIRVYAFGKGGYGSVWGTSTGWGAGGGGGGGCAFGDIAVTAGESVTISIVSGVATVSYGGTTMLTANPGTDAITTSPGSGGSASKNILVTNGGAYSGGSGGAAYYGGGGGSSGSPLGNGKAGSAYGGGGGGVGGLGGALGGGGGGAGGNGGDDGGNGGGAGGSALSAAGAQYPETAGVGRSLANLYTDPLFYDAISSGACGIYISSTTLTSSKIIGGTAGSGGGGGGAKTDASSGLTRISGGNGGNFGGGGGAYSTSTSNTTVYASGGNGGFGGGGGGAMTLSNSYAIAGNGGFGGGGGGARSAITSYSVAGSGGDAVVLIYA